MKMMMYRQYIITGMNKMNAAELFAEKQAYLDQFHASGYPAAFEDYQSQVRAFFDACDSTCPAEEKNIEDFCKEIAGQISSCAAEQKKQAGFRNEREEEAWQRNCNLFMVAYVFPAILECRNSYYKPLVKAIEKTWAKTFKSSKIKAATFETINSGFHKKILGLF